MKLNKQIQQVKPSATLAITAKAKALKREGVDVIGFGAGEPDFDTPKHICDAAIAAIHDGQTRYTPVGGTPELNEAVRGRIKADYAVEYNASEILLSCGAKHSIYNLLRVIIEEGDEVIVPAPYWVSYPDMIRLAGGVPTIVTAGMDSRFRMNPADLEAAIGSNTKGIILNNPSNPTGAGYDKATLEAIAHIVRKKDLWVIADEIYDKLVYGDHSHTCFLSLGDDLRQRTVLVNGVSKTYAMTGWRIGYAAGPQDWIKAAAKLQGQSTSNPCSISQAAAVAALAGDQSVVEDMRQAFARRAGLITGLLNDIEGVDCLEPEGAFYVFPSIKGVLGKYEDAMAWAADLLEQAHVAVVPGDPFGAPGHIRLSYAISDAQIREGVKRIAAFVAKNCS